MSDKSLSELEQARLQAKQLAEQLQRQIEGKQAEEKAAAEAIKQQRIEAVLKEEVLPARDGIIEATLALQAALKRNRQAVASLRAAGSLAGTQVPAVLSFAVEQAISWWRAVVPEDLGLPPRPSPEQLALAEAEQTLVLCRERVAYAKALPQSAGKEQLLHLRLQGLAAAERRLALLRGKPQPVQQKPQEPTSDQLVIRLRELEAAFSDRP